MPSEDGGLGPALIWIISCLLFICIAGGGACLLAYMTASEPDPSLAVAGFALVCLPWAFWLFTFAYRLLSRACGFRIMTIGGSSSPAKDEEDHTGNAAEMQRNVSVTSHESQMPLASAS